MEIPTMKHILALLLTGLIFSLSSITSNANPLDPDCTAEKAAKSAATKATVGVGGRCSAGEAAKDSAKDAAGIEEKGTLEKRRDDEPKSNKAAKKVILGHSSIKPICGSALGIFNRISPRYGRTESLKVAMPIEPTNPIMIRPKRFWSFLLFFS